MSDCYLLENGNIEEVILSKYPIINSKNIMFENVNLYNVGKDGKIYKLSADGFFMSDIKMNSIDDKKRKFVEKIYFLVYTYNM